MGIDHPCEGSGGRALRCAAPGAVWQNERDLMTKAIGVQPTEDKKERDHRMCRHVRLGKATAYAMWDKSN